MRGEELKRYYDEQIKGHKDTERYALLTPGYINLMKYLHGRVPEKGWVLEIGCNTGYECVAIQSKERKVIGIDIGKGFIEKSKSIGVDARVMDMHDLKFRNWLFDCVYINNTLEHAHTPTKVLSEMFRVLKRGGTAIICIPADYKNPDYIPTENWDQKLHLWKPDKEEFNKVIVDAGFKSVIIDEIDAETMFGLDNRASYNNYLVAVCRK